ncbi:MAG: FAD-dependent oxidoreductase [Thiotrichaceae bacterium]
MSTIEHHSIIIVGAGLSGLYVAWMLQQEKREHDVLLLESRERIGGRILSPPSPQSPQIDNPTDSCIDMGPAWVWPDFQPRLKHLVSTLNLPLFKQNTRGDRLYELDAKTVERYTDQSSHESSYRIVGGAFQLIQALQADLSDSSMHLNTRVTLLEKPASESQTTLTIHAQQNSTSTKHPIKYSADTIILALPPRLGRQTIAFKPVLDKEVLQLWQDTPTWMAGHCKMVFIYDTPFWREQNLSGEVFSSYGPLSEIYDGSPANESYYALTSFVKLNSHQRKQIGFDQLKKMCMTQLQRLFGDASQHVVEILIKDWSTDEYTTTKADLTSSAQHPRYPAHLSRSMWDEQIILAGSEVAREHGGYIEGALESAEEAIQILSNKHE